MNSKAELRGYLKVSGAYTFFTVFFSVLIAAAAAVLVYFSVSYETPEAEEFFPSDSPVGSYCYIDVVAVSNWLYSEDSFVYYTVVDSDNYRYTVRLTDEQFNKLDKAYDYFINGDEDTPAPEPVRIFGLAAQTPSGVVESLAESWSMEDSDDYYYAFGTRYLNCGSSPESEYTVPLVAVIVLLGFGLLFSILLPYARRHNLKRCLKRLEELGELDKAAYELKNPANLLYSEQGVIFANSYVFSKKSGAVIRYSDIVWSFKRVQRYNFVSVAEMLVAQTLTMNGICLVTKRTGRKFAGIIEQFIVMLQQRNPYMLVGYTGDNSRAYRSIVNAERQRPR